MKMKFVIMNITPSAQLVNQLDQLTHSNRKAISTNVQTTYRIFILICFTITGTILTNSLLAFKASFTKIIWFEWFQTNSTSTRSTWWLFWSTTSLLILLGRLLVLLLGLWIYGWLICKRFIWRWCIGYIGHQRWTRWYFVHCNQEQFPDEHKGKRNLKFAARLKLHGSKNVEINVESIDRINKKIQ